MAAEPLHILSCEFPPDRGGVADYTLILSRELTRLNQPVVVWTPAPAGPIGVAEPPGVEIRRLPGGFAPQQLRALDRALSAYPGPRQLLVQWVPHGYGLKSMNWFFCAWLLSRVRLHGDRLQVMVHEPYAPYRGLAPKQGMIASVQRLMLYTLLRGASRVWLSTPTWANHVRPYSGSASVQWLPIWSNIPRGEISPGQSAELRRRYGAARHLVGHFGTYSAELRLALEAILADLLGRREDLACLLLGRGGEAFRQDFISRHPVLAPRLHAPGHLRDDALSTHLSACELMLQPYTGGINVRHGSALAAICHGLPVVSNRGIITESLWDEPFGGVLCRSIGDTAGFVAAVLELVDDQARRAALAAAAADFYQRHFSAARSAAMLLA